MEIRCMRRWEVISVNGGTPTRTRVVNTRAGVSRVVGVNRVTAAMSVHGVLVHAYG